MMSAMKCVNLVIHRPVPLGIKIHYMFIKIKKIKSGMNVEIYTFFSNIYEMMLIFLICYYSDF